MELSHSAKRAGRASLTLAALAFAAAPISRAGAQARPDSVRGRVTTDSGAVIVGADVIVTVAPTTKTVYLSVANVYGANNPALYTYDNESRRVALGNFPFLPTIGAHIAY